MATKRERLDSLTAKIRGNIDVGAVRPLEGPDPMTLQQLIDNTPAGGTLTLDPGIHTGPVN